jgi:hypothetical protein
MPAIAFYLAIPGLPALFTAESGTQWLSEPEAKSLGSWFACDEAAGAPE